MIARVWRGVIRTPDRQPYVDYVMATGVSHRRTPGNRAAYVLTREIEDGLTEIQAFSLWDSVADVRAFAGEDISAVVLYDEDAKYLVGGPTTVVHYEAVEPD